MYVFLHLCVCVYKQQPVLKTVLWLLSPGLGKDGVAQQTPPCIRNSPATTPKFPRPGRAEVPLGHVGLPLPALDPLCHQHETSQDSEILLCKGKKSFILNFRAQPKFLRGLCANFIFKAGHKNSPEFFFLLFSLPAISKNQRMPVYFCALPIKWHIP